MEAKGSEHQVRRIILVGRSSAVLGTLAAATVLTGRAAGGAARGLLDTERLLGGSSRTVTVDVLVQDAAGAALLVVVAVLAALLSLNVIAILLDARGRLLSAVCARLTPVLCRRLVAACCGAGLATPSLLGSAALADDGGQRHACHASCDAVGVRLGGLQLPDLPAGPSRDDRRYWRPALHEAELSRVVVRPGDSLWRLADRHLPPSASLADIATLTARLYTLNRAVIGDDPDLIFPGMTLVAPEGTL